MTIKFKPVSPQVARSEIGMENFECQAIVNRGSFSDPHNYDEILRILGTPEYWEMKKPVSELGLDLESVELKSNAIQTDFIRFEPAFVNSNFIISERVYSVLSEESGGCYDFLPTSLVVGGVEFKYYLLHAKELDSSHIDYGESFFKADNGEKVVCFQSSVEEELASDEYIDLYPHKVVLRNTAELPRIFNYYGCLYIEEEKVQTLEEMNVTGADFDAIGVSILSG